MENSWIENNTLREMMNIALKEKFEIFDLDKIYDDCQNDEELNSLLNTPIKELGNYNYLLTLNDREAFRDNTLFQYLVYLNKYSNFSKFTSEKDGKYYGFLSYRKTYGGSVEDIKMFSFRKSPNITFMKDLLSEFNSIVEDSKYVTWTADVNNPFIKTYIKAIKKYNGFIEETELKDTVRFTIDKNIKNTNFEKADEMLRGIE